MKHTFFYKTQFTIFRDLVLERFKHVVDENDDDKFHSKIYFSTISAWKVIMYFPKKKKADLGEACMQ